MTKMGIFFSALIRRMWNRQFLTFLFFLALSSAFWLFQKLNETYEEEIDVPIELRNLPKGVVITGELPQTAKVTLRDKGITLLNYLYNDKLPRIVLDFSTYARQEGRVNILSSGLIKQLRPTLSAGTVIVAMKPDTLEFYYTYGRSKRVPVKLQSPIKAETGYAILHQHLSPDSVTVLATTNVLDTLRAAYVGTADMQRLTTDIRKNKKLRTIPGVKFMPDEVTVSVATDRLVEKKVTVPIIGANMPEGTELRTFPAQVEVTFQVSMSQYRHITPDDFTVVADYLNLPADGSHTCRLQLTTKSQQISHARLSVEEVEYVIETHK